MDHANSPIRTIIALEHEEERSCISRILVQQGMEVAGEALRGADVIDLIRSQAPDVVILDVHMSDTNGFAVLDALADEERPHVVFVSDDEDDGARAFDYHAIDYVVKPCVEDRFLGTISKIRERLHRSRNGTPPGFLERIVVKSRDRIYFIRLEEVTWIEAAADYVHVHANGKRHIVRAKIGDLERRLDPRRFVRIHRSSIVNLDRICELRPMYHGEYQVVLKDNTELTLSRGYKGRFSQFLINPV